jgi:hypothetical protein
MPRKRTTPVPQGSNAYKPALWEKLVVYITAVFIIGLVSWIVIRNQPFADPNIVVVLRVILSLAAASLGATIPGFLHISWERFGIGIRAGGALALFVLTYLLSPAVIPPQGPPKSTSLVLRMEQEGVQNTNTQQPKKGAGALFEFTLSNPGQGLASIDEIAVEVLDVIDDKWSLTQALVATYKYEARLDPDKRGRIPFANGFKYAPGEMDRFTVNLTSDREGYDYFIRIVVKWYDAALEQPRETFSDVMVARFPSSQSGDDGLTRDERGKRAEQQGERVAKHLEQVRSSLRKNGG